MTSGAPKALNDLGQSLWLDNITRDLRDVMIYSRFDHASQAEGIVL